MSANVTSGVEITILAIVRRRLDLIRESRRTGSASVDEMMTTAPRPVRSEVHKEGVSSVTRARTRHRTNCRSVGRPRRSDRVRHDQCGGCHPIDDAIRRFSASHLGCRCARRSTTPT